jgi:hypothetical protein
VAKKTIEQPTGTFTLDVEFFDDTDPALVLVRKPVSVPVGYSVQEIQLEIRVAGARERAKFEALKTLDARITVGQEISI